ncbi:MAG: GGDEF domain-containing protein, partial [Lachnospiraceae bacterium]|nr:GGDEF domain-containing protein [Lachnospiraceae bacterium]
GVFICYLVLIDLFRNKNHRILAIGVAVLVAIGYRDIIVFDLNKYYGKYGTSTDFQSYSAAGALIFVTVMLVDFILEMREAMFKVAETKFLEKIAYEDVLTNLSTRRRCEEVFDEIDKRSFEYAIIQFDLNNLKTTNDEFGHEMGDALITRFADVLRTVFCEGEVLGRMGGDEFIVMIKDAYGYDVDDKLKQFDEEIDKCNDENADVKVSASYGYCRSSELSKPKARNVYMEADKRMYSAKEKYYKKMGYKRRKNDKS